MGHTGFPVQRASSPLLSCASGGTGSGRACPQLYLSSTTHCEPVHICNPHAVTPVDAGTRGPGAAPTLWARMLPTQLEPAERDGKTAHLQVPRTPTFNGVAEERLLRIRGGLDSVLIHFFYQHP